MRQVGQRHSHELIVEVHSYPAVVLLHSDAGDTLFASISTLK